jgi:uncharacterized protein Yka (UPF0111/DUF47 family)
VEVVVVKLPTAWFLPRDQDTLGLLRIQADGAVAAVRSAADWADGTTATAAASAGLRDLRTEQGARRRAVHAAVRASFSTPIDAEDIVELSERLHDLVEAAYVLVRESELSRTGPDASLAAGVTAVREATAGLREALTALPADRAADLADRAARELGGAEHAYREAIGRLEDEPDLRREVRLRELYRLMDHLAGQASRVAHRVWYAVSKAS